MATKRTNVSNVKELREDLTEVYNGLRNGNIGISEAKEAANVSGKILSSVKSQMEYNKMTQSKRKINFMEI